MIATITQKIYDLKPEDHGIKIIAMIPLINNIVLHIKNKQWIEENPKNLLSVAKKISVGRPGHVIYAPFLAKTLQYLSFKWANCALISLAIFYVISEKHIEHVTAQAQKNQSHS